MGSLGLSVALSGLRGRFEWFWRLERSMISTNQEVIWEMSVKALLALFP